MFGKIRKKYWEKIQGVKASRGGTPKLEWDLPLKRFSGYQTLYLSITGKPIEKIKASKKEEIHKRLWDNITI